MPKEEAVKKLISEFEKGWKSGEEENWISLDKVEKQLGIKRHNAKAELTTPLD